MRSARILVVEDETDVLSLNMEYLRGQGYEVLGAETLAKARALFWEYPPDLILLDVQMPDGSGFDFCTELRDTSTAPVIFLTSMGLDENIVHGIARGGDDYMVKPYSLEVLSARVMAQLRRNNFANSGKIEIPPLTINLQRGRVFLRGEEIYLSQKELQLLAYLASNAGREFSAGELYRAVWGEDPVSSSGAVKTHISNLRKKMRLDESSPFEINFTPNKKYVFLKVRFEAEE